jgi:ABC-type bacteriocin/lantibiotic exporter with double-glycine peptidase domain
MPNVLLPVPHFEQSKDGMCLPACVRMVLAFWGQSLPEEKAAQHLHTKAFGTPISNVLRVSQWEYHVRLTSLTESQLQDELLAQKPVIARVWTAMLNYWTIETSHVVVVVGFDESYVYLNDPSFVQHPITIPWNEYLASWAEFNETAIIIHR